MYHALLPKKKKESFNNSHQYTQSSRLNLLLAHKSNNYSGFPISYDTNKRNVQPPTISNIFMSLCDEMKGLSVASETHQKEKGQFIAYPQELRTY